MKIPEINSPAGNYEKMKFAIHYGADAVYLAGKNFGLRSFAGNFSDYELEKAVVYAHSRKVKVYVTVNIFAKNHHFKLLLNYLKFLEKINVDAIIVSDPGIIYFIKENKLTLPFFISTQANITNINSVNFWKIMGAERVILARELSLKEIKYIRENSGIEIEIFGHGAVCISYSGRCFLSKYMTGRDANLGECTHPCRWNYNLVEEKRPNEFFPIYQDRDGTYIFNSKDLRSLEFLPEFVDYEIDSLKIEGRMKSLYYVSAVTAVYKQALLDIKKDKNVFFNKLSFYKNELKKVSHRHYHSAFLKGNIPVPEDYNIDESKYYRNYDFIGIVTQKLKNNFYEVQVRSKVCVNDKIEILSPNLDNNKFVLNSIFDKDYEMLECANPNQFIIVQTKFDLNKFDILRRCKDEQI